MKTTVVGSYPVPGWLPGQQTREALRDAVLAVLKTQELAGIDVITDGELSRFDPSHPDTNGMIDYFVKPMDGIDAAPSREDIAEFRRSEAGAYRSEPAAILRGPIGEGRLDLQRDWESIRGLSSRPMKFTVTGPHMLAKVVTDRYYRDPARLAMEIAEVLRKQIEGIDAAVLQIDEANITGHPEEGAWAADAINRVLDGARGEKAVHLCFGNYGGQTIQKGHWQALLPFLDRLRAGHVVLECARRPVEELERLRGIRPDLGIGIGVIDVKDNEVESPQDVARAIERMAKVLGGAHRIPYVHPDCGLWMLKRSVADRKLAALAAGRDLYLGKRNG
jgi:5-methyltetrahydropteroyltriglutamate--homocysteine methyltransferase